MAISVKAAKAKGRALQQLVRDKLIELLKEYGIEAGDIKSAVMGETGEDIQLSPLARTFLPISIECKAHKAFAIYKHWEQATGASGDRQPVLVIKGDRKKPLACIYLDYYIELEYARIKQEEQ